MATASITAHRIGALAALAAALALGLDTQAEAHPHVYAKVRTQLITEGGELVGLRHTWVFDETWLNSQLEQHDTDKDGRLTEAELVPLVEESKATLEMFKSFTVVRAGGTLVRVVRPRDLLIEYHGPVLGLSFTVSLAKPVPLKGDLLLEVYDATYFSSFAFDGADAVTITGTGAAGCTVKADAPASPQQMNAYRLLARQFGPEAARTVSPRSAAIACGRGTPHNAADAPSGKPPVSLR